MRILRNDGYRRVLWRNGGGETAEILVHPPGAGGDAVEWRVSMAPVVTAGPFSDFPGLDRVLTVIDGRGLALAFGDAPPVEIGDAPFAFPGDVPCRAELRDGPIVDLKVMTRRGRWRAAVREADAPACVPGAAHHLVFAAHGPLRGTAAGSAFALGPRDTLLLDPDESAALALAGRWLDIQLVPQP